MLRKLLSSFFILGGSFLVFLSIYYPIRQRNVQDSDKKIYKYEIAFGILVGLIYFVLGLLLLLNILSGTLFNIAAIVTAVIVRFIPKVIDKVSKYKNA